MRKLIFAVLSILCAASMAHAQATIAVSAVHIQGLNGAPLVAGSLCFQATDANDNNIGIQVSGGGTVISAPFCTSITNGAISSFNVPNPSTGSPLNFRYRIYITQGPRPVSRFPMSYLCNQAGSCTAPYTFNFDTCLSSGACIANPVPIVTGPAGISGPPGLGCNFRATYSSGTTYALSDCVLYSGSYYISLINSNLANTPSSSPSDWQPISSVPCPTTAGALQINSSGVFGCANGLTTPDGNLLRVQGPIPWIDATSGAYGMRSLTSPFSTITVTTGGTSTVTTTGISDFIKGDGIAIPGAAAATSQSTPSAPSVSVVGTTGGSSTINYKCVGIDALGGLTAASAAGSTTSAPSPFGAAATQIASISRTGTTVNGTTSTNMPFTSGSFQAVIANVTGGAIQFSGLATVTLSSATAFSYTQSSTTESGTVSAGSYILLKPASYVVTTAAATAGSNQVVLTTSINHNIAFTSSTTRPVKIFVDGVDFSGANPRLYADGTFAVAGVTANTITINTSYTSPITTTGAANISYATSGIAQMTVTVYPVIDVACPAISGSTVQYAVYGDYGSGYARVGVTPYDTNILEDYGPAWTQTGFVPSPSMGLPSTPPVSATAQTYRGQITNISGSTLTVTPAVTGSLTSVTAYHDNGSALLAALAASCTGTGLSPVYIPQPTGVSFAYYLFSAPLDLTASGCSRVNILDGGPLWLNGTMFASNVGYVDWERPQSSSGWSSIAQGLNAGGQVLITGYAPTLMMWGTFGNLSALLSGMQWSTLSNGQVGLEMSTSNGRIDNSEFTSTNGTLNISSIPLYIYDAGFGVDLSYVTFQGSDNWMYPVTQANPNTQLGDPAYWPIPTIEIAGTFQPKVTMRGINYGVYRGIQFDNLYQNLHTLPSAEIDDVDTFQAPQGPLVTIYGGDILDNLSLTRDVGDSVQNAIVGCVSNGACAQSFYGNLTYGTHGTVLSGSPFRVAFEILGNAGGVPAQNTNECYLLSSFACSLPQTSYGAAVLTGTGACATGSLTTQLGAASGQVTCGGSSGASTLTITPSSPAAANAMTCSGSDVTAGTGGTQLGTSTTFCKLTFTSVSTNDVIAFSVGHQY